MMILTPDQAEALALALMQNYWLINSLSGNERLDKSSQKELAEFILAAVNSTE